MKKIFIIIGSASAHSANRQLVDYVIRHYGARWETRIWEDLKDLPPFDPELSAEQPPRQVQAFRQAISQADAVLICTPEYIFSIPAGLKNALEWCVADTIFSDKVTALITASAQGQKGHEALQLILQTLGARLHPATNLLIQGIKGKISPEADVTDSATQNALSSFAQALEGLLYEIVSS